MLHSSSTWRLQVTGYRRLQVIGGDEKERTRLRYTSFGEKNFSGGLKHRRFNAKGVEEHENITNPKRCVVRLYNSGAPAGAEGARGRSTIAIEIGNPSSRENLDVTSVRPSVRPYARIRAGDEFVFVLDLESFSGKQ